MSEKNKVVVRRFYDDVFTVGKINIAAMGQNLADDFVGHDLPPGLNGRIDKYPVLIAVCRTAQDVVLAVNFARDHNLTRQD